MNKTILEIPLKDIIPNRHQPRINFDEEGLSELTDSIKQFGIIQPLVVRKQDDKYEIVAGERRYKAALLAGLQTVPVIVSKINEDETAELALTENIQRKNLSVIEEAKSLKNLLDRGYLTQEQLATKMGLSQMAIANKLKLLELDEEVQEALLNAKISERHAKSLLDLDKEEQKKWLQKIITERLNVRDLEFELKKVKNKDNLEEDLIPIVNINPNIENILNNAEDITVNREPHDVASFLIPEGGKQEEHKTTFIIPEPPEKIPNKFFNFLEDEEANMNVPDPEEIKNIFEKETAPIATPIEILEDEINVSEVNNMNDYSVSNFEIGESANPVNNEPFIEPSKFVIEKEELQNEVTPPVEENNLTVPLIEELIPTMNEQPSILNEPTLINSDEETELEKFENPEENTNNAEEVLSPFKSIFFNNEDNEMDSSKPVSEFPTNQIEEIVPILEEPLVDPLDSIVTLEPDYAAKQEELAGTDLKTAINKVRATISDLELSGFNIELEEADLEDQYYFNIKIIK